MNSQTCITNGAGLERVRYFSRQLMTADDMLAEQQYFRQKLRRHNRFLHGWGVACGLQVVTAASDTYPWQVIVGPGYAIDPCGDEIYVAEPRCFNIAECIASVLNSCDPAAKPTPVLPDKLYLSICYRECETRPMRVHPLGCACDETLCEYSRIRDDFELTCQTDPPPPHPDVRCELCDGKLLVATCPPCPDNPCLVLTEIALDRVKARAIASKTDVMKVKLEENDINMLVRRPLLSTTLLQEQLTACCCPQPPAVLSAELNVTKTGKIGENSKGRTELIWTITIKNAGVDHTENVVVTDILPSGATFKTKGSSPWESSGKRLTANLGPMNPTDQPKVLTVITTVPTPGTNDSATHINTVEVSSSTADPKSANASLIVKGPVVA